jgi:lysophospholipase L1-like esterase
MKAAIQPLTIPTFRIRPSIILFGDSITEQAFGWKGDDFPPVQYGWAALLAASYSRRADVFNRGYSGYTTRHAVDMLPRVFAGPLLTSPPLFCTVFFGANDAALPGELQHVPIEEYGQNLNFIVQHIRKTLDCETVPILLITPPPFHAEAWMSLKQSDTPGRDNQVSKNYGDEVKEVAGALANCSVVDPWNLLEGNSEKRNQYLTDGLHLNEAGNKLVYEGIMSVLMRDFPHVLPITNDEKKQGKVGLSVEEPLWRELFAAKQTVTVTPDSTTQQYAELASLAVAHLRSLSINFVALDFDRTLVKVHTGGRWEGTAEELAQHLRPQFTALVQAIAQSNRKSPALSKMHMAVVTFSGQTSLIRKALATICHGDDVTNIPIRGSDKSWKEPYPTLGWWPEDAPVDYDAGKQPHMLSAALEIDATHNSLLVQKSTSILIDDDAFNIQVAHSNGVRAVHLHPSHPEQIFSNILALT